MTEDASDGFPDAREEHAARAAGFSSIAGVDEVGRGALAGPLVAAAIILPESGADAVGPVSGVRDSKMLTPVQRAEVYDRLLTLARSIGVGFVSAPQVDLLGLTKANELAMLRAVRSLSIPPDYLLIDAFRLPSCPLPQKPIIHGDALCISIAAASIVAKVVRDRWMCRLDEDYPHYGLASHKGYAASSHRRALQQMGPSPIHRRSYLPVAELLMSAGE